MNEKLFIVRQWDGWDGIWIDVSKPLPIDSANEELNKWTDNGTKNTKFSDGDYYSVFPADTTMHFSDRGPGGEMLR